MAKPPDLPDLPFSLFANPAVPTPSWEPRCAICKLARDNREAHEWVTQALVNATVTQEEIARVLGERWGVKAGISQLSRHKTRHLLPDLQATYETFIAAQAVLQQFGDMPPLELAQRVSQVALFRLTRFLDQAEIDPKTAAGVAGAVANLAKTLIAGELADVDIATANEDLSLKRVERAAEEANYQREVIRFFSEHAPHLLPALHEALAKIEPKAPAP